MPQIANFLPGTCNLALMLHFKRSCCLRLFIGGRLYVSVYVFFESVGQRFSPPGKVCSPTCPSSADPACPIQTTRSRAACSFRRMPFSRAPSVLTLRVQTASIKGWPLTSIPHSRTGTILSSLLVRRWPMMFHPQVLCSSFFTIWTLQKSSAVGQITLGNGHRCALLFGI